MEFINENWLKLVLALLLLIVSMERIKGFFKRLFDYILKELKYFSLNLITNTLDRLSKFELYLNNSIDYHNDPLKLEDLTANLSSSENRNQLGIYLTSLKSAILNVNVTNIALTGGFGSGKSTIINEFIKQNRGFEYLPISLANFNDEKNDEKIIEASIVQQILYFEKKKKLKESSFNRIYFSKPYKKIAISSLILAWLYSIIYLFFEKINLKISLIEDSSISYAKQIFSIIFIVGIFNIIYKSFNVLKNIKFSKITQSSIEIVNEKTDKDLSVFNRNIEEIIYFFEKTSTNVVIIEDIDRFNDEVAIKLFSKIRELSLLLKQAKDISQPIKFIFSIKDELILNQKTKFFDLIIPVIPIIDYKNSKNKFFDKLKEFIEADSLNRNFIAEVAAYIYDMRTVINICNEFKIYYNILDNKKTTLDSEKLFSIILYKNLFPGDFAQIQKRKSRLHQVFFNKRNDVNIALNFELQKEFSELGEKIIRLTADINGLIDFDINELRKIYIYEAILFIGSKYSDDSITKIEDINIFDKLIMDDENFAKIKNSTNLKFTKSYGGSIKSGISFKEIEESINPYLGYSKREQLLKDLHQNKLSKLKHEKLGVENIIKNNIKLNLCDLYLKYPNEIEKFIDENYSIKLTNDESEVLNNVELVKYLLKNNYLNEDFIEYISYFHEGSLTLNDNDLKMKIIQDYSTSFDEKIDDVFSLVNEIQENRFNQKSVLIFDIFNELLLNCQNPHLRNNKLDLVLSQLFNYKNDNTILFIKEFVSKSQRSSENLSDFYVEMTKWDGFWELVEDNFSEGLKRIVLFDLVHLFSGDELGNQVLININRRKKLSTSIENDKDFLKDIFDRISPPLFIQTLKALSIKFTSITFDNRIKEILEDVYKNNLYKLNVNNLKFFAKLDVNYVFLEKSFLNSNYTFLSTQDTPLFKMIRKNKDKYLEEVYFKLQTNINENVDSISQLLECGEVKIEHKINIIEKGFDGKFNRFGKIDQKELFEIILQKNKIFASWENILEYFSFESKLNEISIEFINQNENYEVLSVDYLLKNKEKLFGEDYEPLEFIYMLINAENILDDCFKSIFNSVEELTLDPSKITIDNRLKFLIGKVHIELNTENYEYLRNKNLDFTSLLIEKSENDFMENIDHYNIDEPILNSLLSSEISLQNKKTIIKIEELVVLHSTVHFLQKLTEFFLKNSINDYSHEVYYHILDSEISEELKIELFNLDFPTQDDNEISISLEKLGGNYFKILSKEIIEFPNQEPFITFLNIMKEKRLIRRTYEKKNNILKVAYND